MNKLYYGDNLDVMRQHLAGKTARIPGLTTNTTIKRAKAV